MATSGSALPATFYLGDPAEGNILCVAYTEEPVPVEECREVSCAIDNEIMGTIVTRIILAVRPKLLVWACGFDPIKGDTYGTEESPAGCGRAIGIHVHR